MQTPELDWHKSSRCQTSECVEISAYDGMVLMRSSAAPESGYICFTEEEFDGFLGAAKAGKFDLFEGRIHG